MGRKIICESCGTEFKFEIAKDFEKCPVCGALFDEEVEDEGGEHVDVAVNDKVQPESVKLIVFICQSTIRLAKSRKCTLIMLNKPVLM